MSEHEEGLVLRGLAKDLGGRSIVAGLDLTVAKGELVCLLGPSGCGKTTTLRMVAGFVEPDQGEILIGGRPVTSLPPDRRPTAMVFQNYALWPHMTVFGNVAFGLKLRGLPKREIRERVGEALELVGLSHHAESRPAHISGGEQQRVALARALVLEPKVLLLDEPLSNLDAKLRVRVRDEIREIQQRVGITTVLVTHDQDEALSVADRIAVMNSGRIEQLDTPSGLYDAPATRFVAGFVGTMNFLEAQPKAGALETESASVPCDTIDALDSDPRIFGIRPENVMIGSDGAGAQVIREVPRGHFREVLLSLDGSATQLRSYVPVGAAPVAGSVRVRFSRAHGYPNDEV
ncbi:MAG TPA: ABC transporter ATP-binding protein [Actinospica sp.]|nr:ABC transporter ATP-binding protein [Actinospica sp.]